MVQEQTYSSYSYDADPRDRKSTYKAMETGGYKRQTVGNSKSPGSQVKQGTTAKADSWGPIFKNKQHFVEMHFC